jgi:hypothetical protein
MQRFGGKHASSSRRTCVDQSTNLKSLTIRKDNMASLCLVAAFMACTTRFPGKKVLRLSIRWGKRMMQNSKNFSTLNCFIKNNDELSRVVSVFKILDVSLCFTPEMSVKSPRVDNAGYVCHSICSIHDVSLELATLPENTVVVCKSNDKMEAFIKREKSFQVISVSATGKWRVQKVFVLSEILGNNETEVNIFENIYRGQKLDEYCLLHKAKEDDVKNNSPEEFSQKN